MYQPCASDGLKIVTPFFTANGPFRIGSAFFFNTVPRYCGSAVVVSSARTLEGENA